MTRENNEQVDHPGHYGGDTTYETIKVMRAWDPVAALHFCRFNAVKYLSRVGKKEEDPQVDYKKASWYAQMAVEIAEELDV